MFDKNLFSSRIKLLRQQNKISQSVLAEVLGVTKTQISDLENGKTTTNLEKLVILAKYFDVTTDYLLGCSDDPTRH